MTTQTFEQITEGFNNRLHAFIANRLSDEIKTSYIDALEDDYTTVTFEGLMEYTCEFILMNLSSVISSNTDVDTMVKTFNINIDIFNLVSNSKFSWGLENYSGINEIYESMKLGGYDINDDDDFREIAYNHLPKIEIELNEQALYLAEMSNAIRIIGRELEDESGIYSLYVNGENWTEWGV